MNSHRTMEVVKRDGTRQKISFDKVKYRIHHMLALPEDLDRIRSSDPALYKTKRYLHPLHHVDPDLIAQKVIAGMFDGVTTTELDETAAAIAQPRSLEHPEYGDLASRISVSNHHKNTLYALRPFVARRLDRELNEVSLSEIEGNMFAWTTYALYANLDTQGQQSPLVAPYMAGLLSVPENTAWIESQIAYDRDYRHDFMGFKLLMETYLQKTRAPGMSKREIIERPQYMFMRVAIGIHCAPRGDPNPYAIANRLRIALEELADPGNTDDSVTVESVLEEIRSGNVNDIPLWRLLAKHSDSESFWYDVSQEYVRPFTEEEKFHIARTYEGMSNGYFTHATPTLFNAGTLTPQLSSCYLTTPEDDSIEGIAHWWENCAKLSKWAGGIGSHVHKYRAEGSYIRGTGGTSNGIKPWIKTADQIAVGVDQGGNKRPGSHAVYLAPWHADIEKFLNMRKIRANDEEAARNLFYAVWKNDEFMRCVEADADWYLMCPDECPGLAEAYDERLCTTWLTDEMIAEDPNGFKFTALYRKYIREGNYKKIVPAKSVWELACELTIETGVPYQLNADASNRKTNQSNVGTIQSSNLCTEILEFSGADETAVCNLTSICLPAFVDREKRTFDYEALRGWVRTCAYNLNRIIDINFYPIKEARLSNMRHRPMGIGVQGLSDVYTALRLPFDSEEANEVNFKIFEVIYMEALRESTELARKQGVYPSYHQNGGCPASRGLLQMDLWKAEHERSVVPSGTEPYEPIRFKLDEDRWKEVRALVAVHGLRNSLFVAPMPTGSTSTIMGNSPCFEPHASVVYKRRNRAGEFTVINRSLIEELIERGLWISHIKNQILSDHRGSLSEVNGIPQDIKDIYKISWDIRNSRAIVDQALTRGVFVDQSQSMSLFLARPTVALLTQIHFYSWRRGLKTGSYYTRRLPPLDAQKIQVVKTEAPDAPVEDESYVGPVCMMEDGCVTCSS